MTDVGGEYGTTTGRRRRVGWFDALVARYADRVNGFTDIFLTKLDVLSEFDTLKVCTGYDVDGTVHEQLPADQTAVHHAEPVYTEVPGWGGDITEVTSYDQLPAGRARLRRPARGAGGHPDHVGVDRPQALPDAGPPRRPAGAGNRLRHVSHPHRRLGRDGAGSARSAHMDGRTRAVCLFCCA